MLPLVDILFVRNIVKISRLYSQNDLKESKNLVTFWLVEIKPTKIVLLSEWLTFVQPKF
jgi:hypothetical protein